MKKFILFIVLIGIVAAGVYYLSNNTDEPTTNQESYTIEESKKIAKDWIKNESPTYTYDGEDLQFKESRALDSVDCKDCYEFDFSFKSRHGGFGDREGEMVTQAITPHITTVTVEHGKVTKVLTDNEFNEITGEVRQGGQGVDRLQPKEVSLYYYNEENDKNPEGKPECSPEAVKPIKRIIPAKNPIKETIRLLLEGDIRENEAENGFTTEFPHGDFRLKEVKKEDGTLTITFPDVPGFTSGGSCRVTLLSAQITKTAMQFPEIEDVRFEPETLFQP